MDRDFPVANLLSQGCAVVLIVPLDANREMWQQETLEIFLPLLLAQK